MRVVQPILADGELVLGAHGEPRNRHDAGDGRQQTSVHLHQWSFPEVDTAPRRGTIRPQFPPWSKGRATVRDSSAQAHGELGYRPVVAVVNDDVHPMTSLLTRLVGRLVTLREGEAATALLMFAYSFLAMTAYNILKPDHAVEVHHRARRRQPAVRAAGGRRPDRRADARLQPARSRGCRAAGSFRRRRRARSRCSCSFWFLFRTGGDWVSVAFYVLGLMLGILLISQFWTLANDIYDPRQARRLFGFIGGGASLGGATGAAITAFAVEEVGTNNLLLVSAAMLSLCVGIVAAIVRRQPITADLTPVDERGVGGGEAIRLLRRLAPSADHRARDRLRGARRHHHRAAAQHGGGGDQGRGGHRRHHGLPGAGDVLPVDHRLRRAGRPDQPHSPLARPGLRAADPAGQPRRDRHHHPVERRALGAGRRARASTRRCGTRSTRRRARCCSCRCRPT